MHSFLSTHLRKLGIKNRDKAQEFPGDVIKKTSTMSWEASTTYELGMTARHPLTILSPALTSLHGSRFWLPATQLCFILKHGKLEVPPSHT